MTIDVKVTFEILFSEAELFRAFEDRHSESSSRGLDRRNGFAFAKSAELELLDVSRKCLDGSYRFTPYLESLRVKDRASPPRLISIPCIRDRVVLTQLQKLIRLCFPIETKPQLASEYIRRITDGLKSVEVATTWTAGRDIRKFYDSLDRARLERLIHKRITYKPASRLIHHAIHTPTVPKTYRKKDTSRYRQEKGVPQGLAVSNSLAAIYMSEVDEAMRAMPIEYFRFVDDVLLIGTEQATAKAVVSFGARVRARGLSTHVAGDKKGHHLPLLQRFSYLGYQFSYPTVTVRERTIERLLHSLAARIADFKHNKANILKRKQYLTPDILRAAFVDELNERITGAISKKRRYGWIAYYSQISDLTLLHRLDGCISAMIVRDADLAAVAGKIKRFARAIFEIRHRPDGGYVRDYDKFITPVQKLKFLVFRGQVAGDLALSEKDIVNRFDAYRDQQLNSMLADEGSIY